MSGRTVLLALIAALACPAGAAAGTAVVESRVADMALFGATGCGAPSSVTVPLPAGTIAVDPRRPRVGATGRTSRVSEVAVLGASVRITAVGAGEEICDPAYDPDIPPAEREWSDVYPYDLRFTERVRVAYWSGAGRPKARPRRVEIPGVAWLVNIRWRSIGGRKAVGRGRIRAINPPGVRCDYSSCPGHGARAKVVLSRPSRCPDIGTRVYYNRVSAYMAQRARFLRKGELYSYGVPGCSSRRPRPV